MDNILQTHQDLRDLAYRYSSSFMGKLCHARFWEYIVSYAFYHLWKPKWYI